MRCNERRGTGEGTRAGMSRLLVSQTRGRYRADQWQSTGRRGIFVKFGIGFPGIRSNAW
jgi:hypothetical protein